MRFARSRQRRLGVERTVVVRVECDEDDKVIVASVRPRKAGFTFVPLGQG